MQENRQGACSPHNQDREKTAAEISAKVSNFQAFFNTLGDIGVAMYIVDPATYEIIAANSTAEKFLGQNPIGKKCYQLLLKKRTKPCENCCNAQIVQGATEISTIPWEFKSEDRWYKSISKVVDGGEYGNLKMELIFDITEVKQMERELNRLKVFKEKVEDLPHVAVFTFSRRGKIEMINQAAMNLLGYKDKDLAILHIWHILDENIREQIYNLIEHFSSGDRQTIDCTVLAKDRKFDAYLDILLHRDVKGNFMEGTAFIIEKSKKIIRFY